MCDTYQEITGPYNNLLDKINATREEAPEIFRLAINIGKYKELLGEYEKIKEYETRATSKKTANKRLSRVYASAEEIPIDDCSRIVMMCDCHRGDGSWGDGFSRNRNLYLAALNHYYRNDYTYIEIGDGDDLWEIHKLSDIINVHRDVFRLLAKFFAQDRLYFIFGNHDMVKKDSAYVKKNLFRYFDERKKEFIPLFKDIKCHEGLVLRYTVTGDKIFLTHGHQIDLLNYDMWKLGRFLVRYLWRPLNLFGINDPTSTAKNYRKKERVENKLTQWVIREQNMLISGHTHRPMFPEAGEPPYFNCGSSVHPDNITGIEITEGNITLIKWNVDIDHRGQLFIKRKVMAGPTKLTDYLLKERFPVKF